MDPQNAVSRRGLVIVFLVCVCLLQQTAAWSAQPVGFGGDGFSPPADAEPAFEIEQIMFKTFCGGGNGPAVVVPYPFCP